MLKEYDGEMRSDIELFIEPFEYQSESQLKFTWEPTSFTEKKMEIQLEFENIWEISSDGEDNRLSLKIWNRSLFVRKSDQATVTTVDGEDLEFFVKIPRQISKDQKYGLELLADTLGVALKGGLVASAAVSFATGYSMNYILGQIRSLGLITHFMMIQLSYPVSSVLFYSIMIEFVTFDLIPTDNFYNKLFGFENEALSQQADEIGYSSRYVIFNAGSIPIFMLLALVL